MALDPQRIFGFLLRDVSRLYAANFQRHASGLNLTLEQCRVLAYLERNEGLSQARLAWLSDTAPMTLGRIVDKMERDGLIERRDDPADRRARCLYLRAAARPVLKEIWRVSDRARAESFARMPAADRETLLGLLQQMQGNLEALMPPGADAPRAVRASRNAAAGAPSPRAVTGARKRTARTGAAAKA